MTPRWSVEINGGPLSSDDNAVYYCDIEPQYEAKAVQVGVHPDDTIRIVFAVLVPTNGRAAGKTMYVPIERVVNLATD